jgi:nitroreductase
MQDYPFRPLDFERLGPGLQHAGSHGHLDRSARLQTVRDFSPDRVASLAPSGANQRPWRFVVVTDTDTKQKIRAAGEVEDRESYENLFPDEWLQFVARLRNRQARTLDRISCGGPRPHGHQTPVSIQTGRITRGSSARAADHQEGSGLGPASGLGPNCQVEAIK